MASLCLGMILCIIPAFATPVSANPFPPISFDTAGEAVLFIALANLSVDILLFSLFLYLAYREFGALAGKITHYWKRFIGNILAGGVVIAIAGAFIDFFFLCHETPVGFYMDIRIRAPFFSSDSPGMAMLLVAASVYAVSVLIVRLNRTLSLIPSFAIGFTNLIAWISLWGDDFENATPYLISTLFSLAAIVPLYAIIIWHSDQHRRNEPARLTPTREHEGGTD